MKPYTLIALAALSLGACHGARCADSTSPVVTSDNPIIATDAAEQVAIDAVYTRHPTRALVDILEGKRRDGDPLMYDVHVEMTGSPEARAIYDVVVSDDGSGNLSVTAFEKVQ